MLKLKTLFLLSALASSVMAATSGPLPFINDDIARARTEAARGKVPLFVEVGAPW
jgi:hypothetical protein